MSAHLSTASKQAAVALKRLEQRAGSGRSGETDAFLRDAESCRSHMRAFVQRAWDVVEPGAPLVAGWHIDAICEHLEAISKGQIRRLIVNVPPGHMKSLLVSVFWPAWEWASKPERRGLFASYAGELSIRDSVRCRSVVESDWYRRSFVRDAWSLSSDQNVKGFFQNTRMGSRIALGVAGRGTGFRGDVVAVDDAISSEDAYSGTKRERALRWWQQTMSSRVNNIQTGAFVVIGQRLHEDDLPGHLIKGGGYELLCLPSEFDPKRRSVTSIGWKDPREKAGDLLFPAMFPQSVLDEQRTRDLGPDGYAGQHQQSPVAGTGNIFQRDWWKRTDATAEFLAPTMDEMIQSWDMTFKGEETNDFVVGQLWGRKGANVYLLDQVRQRLTFTQSKQAVVDFTTKWPKADLKLIEEKANGAAIISELRDSIAGIVAENPDKKGDKVARARAISPFVAAGNVWIPNDAPYALDFISELSSFPRGANDDQVDAATQGISRLLTQARDAARQDADTSARPEYGTEAYWKRENDERLAAKIEKMRYEREARESGLFASPWEESEYG